MKFAIVGPGVIAHRFADAVGRLDDVEIAAVVSQSSPEKAKAFAEQYHIPVVCSRYEEVLALPQVDAVYIALVNPLHLPVAKLFLAAGVPVLCEKPLCLSAAETEELTAFAQEKNVLLMEAMWTLHLPCVQQARRWVEEGRIGTVKYMESTFSFYAPVMPEQRLFSPALGGGAALDVGVYVLAFSLYMSGNQPLQSVQTSVYRGVTGVDEMGAALLQFADGSVANCRFGTQGISDESAVIYGDKGMIRLPSFWKCREAVLAGPAGNTVETCTDPQENGFVHQILAFQAAWAAGKKQVPITDHTLSVRCARLLDRCMDPA